MKSSKTEENACPKIVPSPKPGPGTILGQGLVCNFCLLLYFSLIFSWFYVGRVAFEEEEPVGRSTRLKAP